MNVNQEERFVEELFPTPVFISKIISYNFDIIQQEMQTAVSKIEWKENVSWGGTHLVSNDFTENDIETYKMYYFKNSMVTELRNYLKYIGFDMREYTITSWFSKFRPGDYGHIHSHGNNDISGCYYFKTNQNDGNIFMVNPIDCAESSLCFSNRPAREYQAEVGKMLFFPSWMRHGIKKNNSDEDRISFAFNIKFNA